jgi:GntR family transcriptional regulator / MocR family aminotransferase
VDWIKLDRKKSKDKPLFWQLADELRRGIHDGLLPANYKLPSSRTLCDQLQVSRNVVITAYEQLAIEGYLKSKQGSGNYIQAGGLYPTKRIKTQSELSRDKRPTTEDSNEKTFIDFRAGVPALDLFPARLWGQLTREVCQTVTREELGYGESAGSLHLRQVLCEHLRLYRGIESTSDLVVITGGAAQAFTIIANLLKTMVKEVIMEDPFTKPIQLSLLETGLTLLPISVDEHGLQTENLPDDSSARGIFVTPSHQFPSGEVLSIQRRIALVEFARHSQSYIIEDDYDSEFRHHGSPLPTLRELAPDRVIYVGTLSKMLFPGLRLGYVILPPQLVSDFNKRKRANDLQSPIIEQLTLARFIKEGYLRRHILQMKKIYKRRRVIMIQALQDAFADEVRITGDATGLHLIAEFPNHVFTSKMLARMEENGLRIYPVEDHAIVPNRQKHRLIFGYGNLSTEQIQRGIAKLAATL